VGIPGRQILRVKLRTEIASAFLAAGHAPRLTVVRAGGLGDTVLLLPALRLLRRLVPQVELTLVGSAWAERLQPLVDFRFRLVRFDSPLLVPLFGPAPGEDPSGAFARADAAVLYVADPGDELVASAKRFCGGPVVTWPVNPPSGVHAAVHFARAFLEGVDEAPAPGLSAPTELRRRARKLLDDALGPRVRPVAVHPGSGGARKCWPPEEFAALIRNLDRPTVLLRGPADEEACRRVLALLPDGNGRPELSGLEVAQAGAVLAECRLYVGNDSGLTHLAAGLGVPTVAVFGPTEPAVWAPLGPQVRVVRAARGQPWPSVDEVLAACRSHPFAAPTDAR